MPRSGATTYSTNQDSSVVVMESGIASLEEERYKIDNSLSNNGNNSSSNSFDEDEPPSPGPSAHFKRRFRNASITEEPRTSSVNGSKTPLSFALGADSDSEEEDAFVPSPPSKNSASKRVSRSRRSRLGSEELSNGSLSSIGYGFPSEDATEVTPKFASTHSDSDTTSRSRGNSKTNATSKTTVQRDDSDSHLIPPPPSKVDLSSVLVGYKLQRTLGEGAFAKVKQAIHKVSGMSVAVKVVYKNCITADYVKENLHREGDLLRVVDHPNVVKLLEIIETSDVYCLVTEIATGGELLDYIVTHNTLSEKEARKYTRQMIKAIQHLHRLDIVHRDLKTENLLLDNDFNLKVVDFGLSNSIQGKTTLQTMCGSPAYTAPELLGGKQYGKPVDIWSIGINLYAMLTGKLPFSSDNVTTLHAMILDQDFLIPDHFSEELRDVLLKILVAKPKNRITLEDLASHPWVCKGDLPPVQEFSAEEVIQQDKDALEKYNEKVLEYMESKLEYDRFDIIESIDDREYNNLHATYLLLCMRLKKKGHLSHKKHRSPQKERKFSQSGTGLFTVASDQHLNKMASGSRGLTRGRSSLHMSSSNQNGPRRRKSVSNNASRTSSRISSAKGRKTPNIAAYLQADPHLVDNSSPSPTSRQFQTSPVSIHNTTQGVANSRRSPSNIMADEHIQEETERTRVQTALSKSRAARILPKPSPNKSHSGRTSSYQPPRRRQSFHVGDVRRKSSAFTSFDQSSSDLGSFAQRTGSFSSNQPNAPATASTRRTSFSRTNSTSISADAPVSGRRRTSFSSSRRMSDALPSINSSNNLSSLRTSFSSASPRKSHSKDKRFDNIRTLRVPLSKALLSQMEPRMILGEVERAVGVLGLPYSVSFDNGVCLVARTPEISIEIELVKVAGLDVHSLHFCRLRGESDEYTTIYRNLLNELEL